MSEPPITIRAIHDSGPFNGTPNRVVIHATNSGVGFPRSSAPGTAHGTAVYFTQKASGGSAHYICDAGGDEQHCVPDNTIAWHAPPNDHSIGIEINADGGDPKVAPTDYSRAQWLSAQCWPGVALAARRTAELCDRFNIPKVRLSVADLRAGRHGICGHVEVSQAFGLTDHSDPGPNFVWPEFMAAVTGVAPSPPAPRKPHPEEDLMYIKCQPDKSKPDVWTALLTGPMFVGLGASEQASAAAAIAAGATVQWVELGTWNDLDRRSHNLCDVPRHVVVDPAK